MFREIFQAVGGKRLLVDMCKEFIGMLTEGKRMFDKILAVFHGKGTVSDEMKQEIHDIDVGVNQAERKIRKQIVEHLSMSPGTDIPFCLILMSTTKDAERVGDMCKNLYEVAEMLEEPLSANPYGVELLGLVGRIERTFPEVIESFEESDKATGREVLLEEVKYSDLCDDLIDRLAASDLPTRKAVAYTLLARYCKRVDAHLSNIASAVVMPLHKLDFFDEKWTKRSADDISGDDPAG
jgi:phosphate uptake regulator